MSEAPDTVMDNRGAHMGSLLKSMLVGSGLALFVIACLYAAQISGIVQINTPGTTPTSVVSSLLNWAQDNLKGSLFPFLITLMIFLVYVERLLKLLEHQAPMEQIAQAEYSADLCTSVFFGIGVIWTAIGMRSALLAGLGGLDSEVAAEVGAFAILQRLVDGGILLALSTTIVGGVGGYCMRIYKSSRTGAALRERYIKEAQASEAAVLDRLDTLNDRLERVLEQGCLLAPTQVHRNHRER